MITCKFTFAKLFFTINLIINARAQLNRMPRTLDLKTKKAREVKLSIFNKRVEKLRSACGKLQQLYLDFKGRQERLEKVLDGKDNTAYTIHFVANNMERLRDWSKEVESLLPLFFMSVHSDDES